jgi:hypothetical protein
VSETLAEVHSWALLAALAEYWQNPQPDEITHRVPGRIAGSEHDQLVPDGISNPYWEIIRQAPLDTIGSPWRKFRPEPDAFFQAPGERGRYLVSRHALTGLYSWSIPSPGDIAWIMQRSEGRGIVEPGAGGGYWAWQLAQAGADIIAYEPADPADNHHVDGEPWFPLLRGDHSVTAQHPDRSLLLCWPTYGDPWAAKALAAYEGDQLFYAGESNGGCCADDAFFELLDAEWDEVGDCPAHVSFSCIHCYLTEYRRKS